MKKPSVHSSRKLLQGPFYDFQEDLLVRPDGQTGSYIMLQLDADAAVILAEDQEGRYILNREYRHPTGDYLLGPPGGRLEPGEDPLVAGKRELLEETGYGTTEILLLGTCYPFPGLCNQKIHFLWAQNCVPQAKQKLDPLEYITTELKTADELQREILGNHQIDAMLCTALWYKHQFRYT